MLKDIKKVKSCARKNKKPAPKKAVKICPSRSGRYKSKSGEAMSRFLVNFTKVMSFVLFANFIHATDLAITAPGVYSLSANIISNPVVGSNNIIQITSSDVVLDLKDFTISQANNLAKFNGIEIAPNVSNVTIKNGTIKTLTGTGINVGTGCSKINIRNLTIDSCFLMAINMGTFELTDQIIDSNIENVIILNSANAAKVTDYAGYPPIFMSNCLRCTVRESYISNCGLVSAVQNNNTFACVYLASCNNCTVDSVKMQNNSVFGAVNLNSSTGCLVKNCDFSGANGNLSSTGGFIISGGGTGNLIDNCVAQNNIAYSAHGFFKIEQSNLNSITNCSIIGNKSNSSTNYFVAYVSNNCLFKNCVASDNTTTGIGRGFWAFSIARTSFIDCVSANNTGTSSFQEVGGMLFAYASYCELANCQFYNNSGSTDALSYGLKVFGGSNNLYKDVSAYANGPVNPIPANQMVGVPAGSIIN